MLCRRGKQILKKDKKDKHLTEPVAAFIIIAALLLTMAVSMLGGWEAEQAARDAAQQAVQAGAQAGPFGGCRQLSDPLLVLVNGQTPLPEGWQVTPRMVDDELVDIAMYEDYAAMSTTSTLAPTCAACHAAAEPDGPPPTTTTSYRCVTVSAIPPEVTSVHQLSGHAASWRRRGRRSVRRVPVIRA